MPKLRIVALPVTGRAHAAVCKLPDAPPQGLIADTLQRHTVQRDRQDRYTLDNYQMHVSDVISSDSQRKFCARERVLGYMSNKRPMLRTTVPGMAIIHTMGHALQDHMTERFIKDNPYGHTVWGDWVCHCYKQSDGATGLCIRHSLKPARGQYRCNECAGEPIHYKEIDLAIPARRLVGHPDILLLWNNVLIIYEVKSIERVSVDFATLDQPLGDHTLQGSFYYWMIRSMHEAGLIAYPPSSLIRYVYVDRSTSKIMGGRVYKEFEKPASPSARITKRLEKSDQVIKAVDTRILPARICDSPEETRAKACRACVDCFSRKTSRF